MGGVLLIIVMFVLGLLLVVKGGDFFVDAASEIARMCRIPTFIIGATIVSVATTLPEMIVSVIAAAESRQMAADPIAAMGKVDMAVGNAVGSVTANTALIMAVAMVAMHIEAKRKKFIVQFILLIAASVILILGSLTGSLSITASIVLALVFVLFMVQNIREARQDAVSHAEEQAQIDKKALARNIFLFIIGAAGIVIGSQLMVDNGSAIATMLHVPDRVIAVTLIAVGTSLPELVTTITAIVKKKSDLSIGNIVGANIIDLSLILPICSLVSGQRLPVSSQALMIDLPACLVVTLIAIVPMIVRQKASRVQGIVLLIAYVGYLVLTVGLMH